MINLEPCESVRPSAFRYVESMYQQCRMEQIDADILSISHIDIFMASARHPFVRLKPTNHRCLSYSLVNRLLVPLFNVESLILFIGFYFPSFRSPFSVGCLSLPPSTKNIFLFER